MLALEDAIYEWLATASDSTTWIMGNQVSAPPMPQESSSFGFYTVDDLQPLSFGNEKKVYNPETDKIDITLYNSYHAKVSIDIYSQNNKSLEDGSQDPLLDASAIAMRVMDWVYSNSMKEYFFANNIGFLKIISARNMANIESKQIRKRFMIEALFFIHSEILDPVDRIVEAPVNYDITK